MHTPVSRPDPTRSRRLPCHEERGCDEKRIDTPVPDSSVTTEWLPADEDVHLRIWLGDVVFDYAVAATAAHNVISDWSRKRWCTVEVVQDPVEDLWALPRLPCERLYLGP